MGNPPPPQSSLLKKDEGDVGRENTSFPHPSPLAVVEVGAHQGSLQSKEDIPTIKAQGTTVEVGSTSSMVDVVLSDVMLD